KAKEQETAPQQQEKETKAEPEKKAVEPARTPSHDEARVKASPVARRIADGGEASLPAGVIDTGYSKAGRRRADSTFRDAQDHCPTPGRKSRTGSAFLSHDTHRRWSADGGAGGGKSS